MIHILMENDEMMNKFMYIFNASEEIIRWSKESGIAVNTWNCEYKRIIAQWDVWMTMDDHLMCHDSDAHLMRGNCGSDVSEKNRLILD